MADHLNLSLLFPYVQMEYYINDVEYADLVVQILPVAVPSGRYKIDIRAQHQNELILKVSVVAMVDKKSHWKPLSSYVTFVCVFFVVLFFSLCLQTNFVSAYIECLLCNGVIQMVKLCSLPQFWFHVYVLHAHL